jgi:hypothetical protein
MIASWSGLFSFSNCWMTWLASPRCRVMASRSVSEAPLCISRRPAAQADSPDPHYPDAHYNSAFACEKLGADAEAQQRWEAYVRLDPADSWVP